MTSGGSGSGKGVLRYSVTANRGNPARAGAISIEGQTTTVTQNGSTGKWDNLGTLAGMATIPQGVSANGQVVVGWANGDSASSQRHAFRWTQKNGMTDLGFLPGGNEAEALAVSGGGGIVVGAGSNRGGNFHAFRWSQTTGMVDLGVLPGGDESIALAVSDNGGVVIGAATVPGGKMHAFRWSQATGMVDLGLLPGGDESEAYSVSRDGDSIRGLALGGDGQKHAFSWAKTTGMKDLGALPGGLSYYNAIAANNDAMVGGSWVTIGTYHAYRWTPGDGLIDLGSWGDNSEALALSANGKVVVGWALNGSKMARAFR